MKVVVKSFAANVSSWSNKEVANFLNEVINPANAESKVLGPNPSGSIVLTPEQIKSIKDKLGSEPKLPASFKEIYQQFKQVKIQSDSKELTPDVAEPNLKESDLHYHRYLRRYNCEPDNKGKVIEVTVEDGKSIIPRRHFSTDKKEFKSSYLKEFEQITKNLLHYDNFHIKAEDGSLDFTSPVGHTYVSSPIDVGSGYYQVVYKPINSKVSYREFRGKRDAVKYIKTCIKKIVKDSKL